MNGLGACRLQAMRFEKACDALPQVDRGRMPQPSLLALALCGDDVQQVQAKNQVLIGEHHDFRFVEGHDVARGYSCETSGVMLIKTEDVLGLKDVGSLYELGEHVAMIGGGGRHFERSLHQKAQMVANVTLADDGLPLFVMMESEFCLTSNQTQIGTVHTLKER